MMQKLASALVFTLGISGFSNSQGQEILNLELLCEGKWRIELKPASGEGYEPLFQNLLAIEIEKREEDFSGRISIQNNSLGPNGEITLRVTDTTIYLESEGFSEKLRDAFNIGSDGIRLVSVDATLDRLTGKLNGRIELDTTNANKIESSENFIAQIAEYIEAVKMDGQCKKLDPDKKLF